MFDPGDGPADAPGELPGDNPGELPGPAGFLPAERVNVSLPVEVWDHAPELPCAAWCVLLYLVRHSYGSGDPGTLLTADEVRRGRYLFPGEPYALRWDCGTGLPSWTVLESLRLLHGEGLVSAWDLWDTDPRAAVCRAAGAAAQAFGVNWATLLDKSG